VAGAVRRPSNAGAATGAGELEAGAEPIVLHWSGAAWQIGVASCPGRGHVPTSVRAGLPP